MLRTIHTSPLRPRWLRGGLPFGTQLLLGLTAALTCAVGLATAWPAYPFWGRPTNLAAWPLDWSVIASDTLTTGRLTALLTNSFVAAPALASSLVLFLLIAGFLFWPWVLQLWLGDRRRLVLAVVGLLGSAIVLENAVLPHFGYGLITSLIGLLWFAPGVERWLGTARFLRVVGAVLLSTHLLAAGLLYVWPGALMGLFGDALTPVFGVGALLDALIALWGLSLGEQRLAILNITGRTLIWVPVVINAFDLFFSGFASGLMGLVAVGVALALVAPKLLLRALKRLRPPARPSPRFKVVQGGRGRGPTLH